MTYKQAIKVIPLVPSTNNALKNLMKWEWNPELFDLYYYDWNKKKIHSIDKKSKEDFFPKVNGSPIVAWEEIKRILQPQYKLQVKGEGYGRENTIWIWRNLSNYAIGEGISYQEAAMRATIALWKEIERLGKRKKNKQEKNHVKNKNSQTKKTAAEGNYAKTRTSLAIKSS